MATPKSGINKEDVLNIEKVVPETSLASNLTSEEEHFLAQFTPKQEAAIYRKLDWRLVPALSLLYLLAIIDRANIGNAKIEGLEASLGMSGTDYNVAVAIFFVSYIIFDIPSNYILSKFERPSRYLATLVVSWGIIMTLTGVVKNFGGLCATRFMLGIFEAGFFPGANYIVGQWYPPHKTQTRIAIFYTASAASGAFSGLLAYAIVKMDGVGGYEGWRWIFLLEGLASVVAGLGSLLCLPDSPSLSSAWLTPDEARFLELMHVKYRGRSSKSDHSPKEEIKSLWGIVKDWQLYFLGLVFMSNTVPNYGLKFTMPQIIKSMGFTSSNAQLLTIPPYAVAAISGLVASLLSDRFTWRMPFLVTAQVLLIIAYAILVVKAESIKDNVPLCYFAVHLACAGLYPIPPGVSAWTVNNLGPRKRAMGIALMVMIGSVGGVIGSFIYLESEAPRYPSGFGSSLALAGAGVVSCVVLEITYWRINKGRDAVSEEEIRAKYSDQELADMDDRSPLFRYNL
ncbi:MFS general substrate transporter [Thozetella sp. PMI_491]|nr:MFS general substrate transporter [Thozetella sp. PMI_491]